MNEASAPAELWSEDQLFRRFVDITDDLMTVVDTRGHFLYVNPAGCRFFGLSAEECAGLSAWDFIHPDDRLRTSEAFESWLKEPEPRSFGFENRQVNRSGVVRNIQWTVTRQDDPRGELACFVSTGRDVTSSRLAEAKLARSEIRLRSILTGMQDPVITIDSEGVIRLASSSCEKVFGYKPGELVGRNIRILMPEPHRSEHDTYIRRYLETGETGILGRTREFQVLRKDGAPIEIELSVSRIDVPEQERPLFCGSFRDVTDRRATEQALVDRERRLRAIFDGEYEFVGLLTPEGKVLEINRTALEGSGMGRDEILGRPFWELSWWSHSAEVQDRIRAAVGSAAAGDFVRFEVEAHGLRDLRTLDFSLKPIRSEVGEIVLLIPEGRDITEIKRAQQRENAMMRAFADIGESASLLAHEIKNPITAVNAALRAVANKLGEDEQLVLEELAERMQKLEKLMRRTLSLARPLELHPTEVDVRDLLEASARTMRPHAEEEGTSIEVVAPADAGCVTVDPQYMEEVLTNLIRNAVDALGPEGRIRLEAVHDPETGMVLRVDDDGPGIPDSILKTLFKPFVSTKANGTGLGLAIARKVVETHGGTIEVVRSPFGGARFEIRLPERRDRVPGSGVRRDS